MSQHNPLSPLSGLDGTMGAGPPLESGDPLAQPQAERDTAAEMQPTTTMPALASVPATPQPEPAPAAAAAVRVTPEQRESEQADLAMRRDRLAGELAQLQWDLGGLTYEMAVRDHFRLDVLVRQAGRLQEVDAELAETERLLRLKDAGAAGTCPTCGSMYARGASFCWKCGTQLLEQAPATGPLARP